MADAAGVSEEKYMAEKDKDSRLDYSFNWADWLAPGDTVVSSTWSADPGITINGSLLNGAIATIWASGGEVMKWYVLTNTVTSAMGRVDQRTLNLYIPEDATASMPPGTALFPNRMSAVASLRAEALAVAAAGAFPSVAISDDYIWSKLIAAEADAQRELGVYFRPTYIIPDDAPQVELDALTAAGTVWAQEAAYDWERNFFQADNWGYIKTKSKPLISVDSIRMVYPGANNQLFQIPTDWIRLDRKYGQIRLVPTGIGFANPLSVFMLGGMGGGGRTVPFMIQVRYTAGLTNAAANWPDLLDVVKKKAVLSIIAESFLPSSGSISADGLSQSISVKMQDYYDVIDLKLNGPKGSNGGLRRAIHGIQLGVL